MKLLYFILGLLISVTSHAVSYTTMTIDAVKQSNGVWTSAGVLDNTGIVRTTGAVSILGSTRNVPVSFAANVSSSSALLRSAGRFMGPAALALAAYDVYEFFSTNDIKECGDGWCTAVDGSFHPTSAIGSCQLFNPYNGSWNVVPNYTPDNCVSQNLTNLSNSTFVGVFAGWIGVTELTTQYQYQARYSLQRRSDGVIVDSYDRYWYGPKEATPVPNGTIATDADFDKMPDFPLPVLSSGFNNIPALQGEPIPVNPTPSFVPFSIWMGDPYFKDGNWYRDRADISPCPVVTNPTRVCVSVGPVKLEGQTDPKVSPPDTDPNYSTAPKTEQEFCAANPNSISCQEMGEAESEPLQNDTVQFNMNPTPWGADNAQCPASPQITLHTGAVVKFDYQPTCDFLAMLRPAIIAFAFMVAIGIAIGRTE